MTNHRYRGGERDLGLRGGWSRLAAPSSRSIAAVFGRPKSMRCAAIGPRLAALSAGPHGVTFRELVKMMVEHDIDLARGERTVNEAGFANSTETPPPQRAT